MQYFRTKRESDMYAILYGRGGNTPLLYTSLFSVLYGRVKSQVLYLYIIYIYNIYISTYIQGGARAREFTRYALGGGGGGADKQIRVFSAIKPDNQCNRQRAMVAITATQNPKWHFQTIRRSDAPKRKEIDLYYRKAVG